MLILVLNEVTEEWWHSHFLVTVLITDSHGCPNEPIRRSSLKTPEIVTDFANAFSCHNLPQFRRSSANIEQ